MPFFYEMEDDTIHIKFSLINPVPIIIILCVLILLAIIVVIANVVFVVMAKKRKNKVKSRGWKAHRKKFSSVESLGPIDEVTEVMIDLAYNHEDVVNRFARKAIFTGGGS